MKANSTNYAKTITVAVLIGLAVMFIISVVFSVSLGKINKYEILYPAVSIILQCVPSFVSTRISIAKHNNSILLTAIINAIIISFIFFLIGIIVNGKDFNVNLYFTSLIFIFLSAILSVFLPRGRRKKTRI